MQRFATNRKIFFLAVNTGYAAHGHPDVRCQEFYRLRCGNGLYCAIVGNVVTPGGFENSDVCSRISPNGAWGQLSRAIAERGARPGIQLTSAWRGYKGMRRFVSGRDEVGQAVLRYRTAASEMSSNDVGKSVLDLRRGIELALQAGFQHIQIHAAHGYLFSLLIDEAFSDHSELMLQELNLLAHELSRADVETSLRFSLTIGEASIDSGPRQLLINRLLTMPFSFFDISFGFYNINKHLIYPSSTTTIDARHAATLDLARRFPAKAIVLSGKVRISDESDLPRNVHFGICRDLIANPDFLRDGSNRCIDCMKCHYFSRRTRNLTCGQWTDTPDEHDAALDRAHFEQVPSRRP